MGRKARSRSQRREAAQTKAGTPAVAEIDAAGRGALVGSVIAAIVLLFVFLLKLAAA